MGTAGGAAGAAAGAIPWGGIFTALSSGASLLQGITGMVSGMTNASYANAMATQARQAGNAEANRLATINRQKLGAIKAAAGASGTIPTSGSPMMVYLNSVKQAALEEETARYGGKVEAIGLEQQAKQSMIGGIFSGVGGLFGAAMPWLRMAYGTSLGSTLLQNP